MPAIEDATRTIRAPRGTAISCKVWQQEAAMRMLMNNLDPEVAEDPANLIVYGRSGRAERSWADDERIGAGPTDREPGFDGQLVPCGLSRSHCPSIV